MSPSRAVSRAAGQAARQGKSRNPALLNAHVLPFAYETFWTARPARCVLRDKAGGGEWRTYGRLGSGVRRSERRYVWPLASSSGPRKQQEPRNPAKGRRR